MMKLSGEQQLKETYIRKSQLKFLKRKIRKERLENITRTGYNEVETAYTHESRSRQKFILGIACFLAYVSNCRILQTADIWNYVKNVALSSFKCRSILCHVRNQQHLDTGKRDYCTDTRAVLSDLSLPYDVSFIKTEAMINALMFKCL